MIVYDLDGIGVCFLPDKTNPPLVINTYAVLSFTAAFEGFEPVTRRNSQIL